MELKLKVQNLRVASTPLDTVPSEQKEPSSRTTATDKNTIVDQFKEINDHLTTLEERARLRCIPPKSTVPNPFRSFISASEDEVITSFVKAETKAPPPNPSDEKQPVEPPPQEPANNPDMSVHEVDCALVFDHPPDSVARDPQTVFHYLLTYRTTKRNSNTGLTWRGARLYLLSIQM